MGVSLEEVKSQLGGLPADERAELASFLIRSLDDREDADADAAWDAELVRRAAEIRAGTARGRPADEVFSELREQYPCRS